MTGYRTARRLLGAGLQLLGRRIRILRLAQAVAAQQEDFGILHEPVGDGGGNGCVEEDVTPVGERSVRGDNGGTLLAVTGGNDLVKEVLGLLIEGQVAKLVHDESGGLRVGLELADQRVIDLRGEQMVQHVHGGGEQDALIGLADAPANDLR